MREMRVNFYRESNNLGYVSGIISYVGDCDNNLVISDREETVLEDTRNSFVVVSGNQIRISSISDLEEVFQESEKLLMGKEVKYHIPKKVMERENLDQKDVREVSGRIASVYGIIPADVIPIDATGRLGGIFYVRDREGIEYMLKHGGKDPDKINVIANVTNVLSDVFPKIIPSLGGNLSLELGDGYYSLEEFVRGSSHKKCGEYYNAVGSSMAYMHRRLDEFLKDNPESRKFFVSRTRRLSKSNMAALWIDLLLSGFNDQKIEVEKLAGSGIEEGLGQLPEAFIHGDLNYSNVIWTPKGPKFIDVESIRISKRVLDLESPLIFQGNMQPPVYFPGSFGSLIDGYNSVSSDPFKRDEAELGRLLTKYALIKNFVIRNIRREEKDNSLDSLVDNLSKLERDEVLNGRQ